MKPWQTAVRYGAIALASVMIFSIAFWGLRVVGFTLGLASLGTYEEAKVYSFNANGIENLKIDIAAAQFSLKPSNGDKITVKTNIKNLTAKESGNTIKIKEKQGLFTVTNTDAFVEIFYPRGFEFDEVDIDSGAGQLGIQYLTTERLDLDLGAGNASLHSLTVTKEAEIDGGTGHLNFSSSYITGLDLDMGVGQLTINAVLNGNNHISLGIGETFCHFYGESEDYYLDVEKGVGEIEYYRTDDANFNRNGQATTVRIEGGIGKISVVLEGAPDNWQ
ncbi:MAG: DUF4097 family beta strand repeat protein [Clostridia bacterium]|nr:DUF4097 family beta strand repeat protein [Clostridia bacterium]